MNWETLLRLLADLPDPIDLDPTDPEAALRRVEKAAELHPEDRILAALVRALHGCSTAGYGLNPVVGGVHRERLVRWDAWTSTWLSASRLAE